MDIFISHFWYIAGTFVLGLVVGFRFKEQIAVVLSNTFAKVKLLFKRA